MDERKKDTSVFTVFRQIILVLVAQILSVAQIVSGGFNSHPVLVFNTHFTMLPFALRPRYEAFAHLQLYPYQTSSPALV